MPEEKNNNLNKNLQGLVDDASHKWQTFKSEFDYELGDLKKVFADLNNKNNK